MENELGIKVSKQAVGDFSSRQSDMKGGKFPEPWQRPAHAGRCSFVI
jgi:hypothetical protein